ncbi:MAG: tRNA (cytosine(32)/uridine(32)-2'-O)-methyltransferase TrmJ [Gammaproteobacteria bacterium]
MTSELSKIRIVLVNTSHAGNIGSVARAMKTMGMSQLYLVDPVEKPVGEARARASGAVDVLESAIMVNTLQEAIADCALVVGASARLRSIPWPVVDPRQCAEQVVEMVISQGEQVALVMGREKSGLSNAELEHCNLLVNIPANPDYSSLNLAAATQVLAYEVRMAMLASEGRVVKNEHDSPLASADDLEGMYSHFQTALTEIGFLDPQAPKKLMRRIRRMFNRIALERNEVNILRGILTAAQGKKRVRGNDGEKY